MMTTRFEPSDRLLVVVERANKLPASDLNGLSDPYLVIKLNDSFEKKTKIIKKNLNPIWNEEFLFFSLGGRDPLQITFEVFDWDRFSKDDFLGTATLFIPSENFEFNKLHQEILNLTTCGTITIHYKIMRKEQRESGMFPSITQVPVSGAMSTHQIGENQDEEQEKNSFFNYEFSPTFSPSLPVNFKLLSVKKEKKVICQCDFEGPYEKPRNNITKEPGTLQISYFNIPQDKFSQIHSEYLDSYFDRLKQSTEIMNGKFIDQEKDITSLFKRGKYVKVLEHTCKANTTDGLLTILTFSCLVGDSLMAVFRHVSYSYGPSVRNILIEIIKQSKIIANTIHTNNSPPSPISSSASSSPSDRLIPSSPSADRVVEVGSLYSLMDENYSLYSPSRLLATPNKNNRKNSKGSSTTPLSPSSSPITKI